MLVTFRRVGCGGIHGGHTGRGGQDEKFQAVTITHTQHYEIIQNNRVGWAGDYDSLEFSRVAYIEEGIGRVFFRPVVVRLVSVIHCLAGICDYRLG